MSRSTSPRINTPNPPSADFFVDASCTGADTTVFFPVSDTFAGEAKAICATCPVAGQCLEYAISTHQSDGVWGGLTAVERHRLVRRRQKVAPRSSASARPPRSPRCGIRRARRFRRTRSGGVGLGRAVVDVFAAAERVAAPGGAAAGPGRRGCDA